VRKLNSDILLDRLKQNSLRRPDYTKALSAYVQDSFSDLDFVIGLPVVVSHCCFSGGTITMQTVLLQQLPRLHFD